MDKICIKCNLLKPEENFYWKRKNLLRSTCCSDCHKLYLKIWYKENKVKTIENSKKHNKLYKERNIKYVVDYLNLNPCVDCKESDIRVLDFDHVRGKTRAISQLLNRGVSLNTLQKEIDKCEVRCANCHRKISYDRMAEQGIIVQKLQYLMDV